MAENTITAEARHTIASLARDILTLTDARPTKSSPELIEWLGLIIQASDHLLVSRSQDAQDDAEMEELLTVARAMRRMLLLLMTEINPDQAWFWTEAWQAKEREADNDYATGRFQRYESTDALEAAFATMDAG